MKKLLFLILFFSFSLGHAQDLNKYANALKENKSEIYNSIKKYSVNKWKDDHSMILLEINKQSESFFNSVPLMNENPEIALKALIKWGETKSVNKASTNGKTDWTMVEFEMEKQIEAKNKY